MTRHKHADVLIAIAEGKEFQFLGGNNVWMAPFDANPIRNEAWDWRIKPEPKEDIVRYIFADITYGYSDDEIRPDSANISITFDGETGNVKSVELLK